MRNSVKHNNVFSLNQHIFTSSQLRASAIYGHHQAGYNRDKISDESRLGLRVQCFTYAFYGKYTCQAG
jgi:hypothetical protein